MQKLLLSLFVILLFVLNCFSQSSKKESIIVYAISNDNSKKSIIKQKQVLDYNQNLIEIDFRIDNLIDKYEYRVEGIHISKIRINTSQKAVYGNLQGGNYELHIWKNDNEIKSLKFSIESAFWQKWWFILSIFAWIVAIIGLIIYFFLLFRFRQQTKLQKVRNDIASDLHDDVGATLSSISFFGEMMRSKVLKNAPAEEILPLLDKVISTSKETIETMRGVVWTINPNNDNAIDFFQKLRTFGNEMLATKNINFQFETSGFEDQKLPLDVQRNLFLFYKECINNIAKHSKAINVGCEIAVFDSRNVSFTIKDNGLGFDPNDLHEGHGLKSLRKRADELEGKLEITSAEGKGTSTKLEFPLP